MYTIILNVFYVASAIVQYTWIRIKNTDPDPQSLTVLCLSSYLEVLPHHHLCQLIDGLVLLDLLLPDHKTSHLTPVLRIWIRDPVPPGSGMGKKSGSGSGMNNPDHIS